MTQPLFGPSEGLALLVVFGDAVKEVELLYNTAKQNFRASNNADNGRCSQAKPDTLLTELNKIFFQTLLRYEKARSEDFLESPDGTFRKLNDEESTKVKFLEVVSRVFNTLRNLLFELDENGTFTSLQRYVSQEQSELDKLASFVSSAANKEKELHLLQEEIQNLQRDMAKESIEFSETITHLKHEFQELREMAKMTVKYEQKEFDSKFQQTLNAHNETIRKTTANVENLKTVIYQNIRGQEETRCWICSDTASKVNLSNLLGLDTKLTQFADRLENMRKQLEHRKELHAQLQDDFETCTEIVTVYDREKEAARLREEYAKKALISAVQIQSWWRTMMSVRGIRLKKKRKGKKGGKNKMESALSETEATA